jgi:membrane dipeptidase
VLSSLALGLASCGDAPDAANPPATVPTTRAETLTRETLLVDTHIDAPYRIVEDGDQDLSVRTASGHFDHPRARQGGLDAPFMAIYVPSSYQEKGGAKAFADGLIDMVEGFAERWPEHFAMAYSADDVERNFAAGLVSLPMGLENGAPIETLDDLRHFHARGIRYVTLVHAENNQICDSSYADDRRWNGLSPYGEEVVREMNQLGIMVDVSHVSDAAFRQVLDVTRVPVIASHSSCRHFTPEWERNMSDEMIVALARNGGVIQINFGSSFLDARANEASTAWWDEYDAFLEEHELPPDSEEAKAREEELRAAHPVPPVPLTRVADHIDHVVGLVGIDHVGIGSDYDGVRALPDGLEDVSRYPALVEELLRRGYSEGDVRKVLSGNFMRVWRRVESYASTRTGPRDAAGAMR